MEQCVYYLVKGTAPKREANENRGERQGHLQNRATFPTITWYLTLRSLSWTERVKSKINGSIKTEDCAHNEGFYVVQHHNEDE